MKRPNVLLVFADQWRAQACGYAGNRDVQTPNLDRFAGENINVTHAISGCPVCSPYRASLLTGRCPLTHGVFVNDVCLSHDAVSLADAFVDAGYQTAYIGKWHVDGHGRSAHIPPERRQGFQYWKVLECTHAYNQSPYFAGDSEEKRFWEGYDAIAQTRDAREFIAGRDPDRPFLLVLSWGPPHAPYGTAPERYRKLYDPGKITLRPNVPARAEKQAREDIAGYYAHCTALDDCFGNLLKTLAEQGLEENTIVLFTSDHGDMLGSQGELKKQRPWDESIRIPFLLRYPRGLGPQSRQIHALIDAPDVMPSLLDLAGLPIPETVEGVSYASCLAGGADPAGGVALLTCPHPFGQFSASRGGREYRGIRTLRYTYARRLDGPWLLYDNQEDPYQQENLAGKTEAAWIQANLDHLLNERLAARHDEFLPSMKYIEKWGYPLNENGTVPYTN